VTAALVDEAAMSVMERIALLDDDERDRLIGDWSADDLADPEMWLRPDQLRAFNDPTPIVLMLAGRGAGKTRVGASWCNEKAKELPGSIGHLVGRTVSDVRDVMIQGDSGILATAAPSFTPDYVPSLRRLIWPNGTHALTFSSEEPSQLRGPQSHWTWVDELAALNHRPDNSGATAWDHVRIGTRLGAHPQVFATTTPKRIQAIRDLVRLARTTVHRVALHGASTLANRANLSPEYLRELFTLYAGTALERQELHGELLDIVEAALWQVTDIRPGEPDFLAGGTISVIGVDPGLTTGGDATGILTVRATDQTALTTRRAVVVADWTEEGLQPERWAARVVTAWRTEKDLTGNVPIIVAEQNAGGEMVASVIEAQAGDNALPVALISAKGTKAGRAEPIVMAYRQDRVRHLEPFDELVEELTSWEPPVPGGSRGSGWSPNRLDAMVHALRAVLVDEKPLRRFGALAPQETSEVLEVPTAAWRRGSSTHGLRLPWRENDEP
jgi:phage terminase large subunit-like protein